MTDALKLHFSITKFSALNCFDGSNSGSTGSPIRCHNSLVYLLIHAGKSNGILCSLPSWLLRYRRSMCNGKKQNINNHMKGLQVITQWSWECIPVQHAGKHQLIVDGGSLKLHNPTLHNASHHFGKCTLLNPASDLHAMILHNSGH